MAPRHILRKVLFCMCMCVCVCVVFKYSKGISKFMVPSPLYHYTFLHKIYNFGEKS